MLLSRIFVTVAIGISCFTGCKDAVERPIPRDPPPVKGVSGKSSAPPTVIPITAVNRPKVVVAGKPTVRVDSSNGGVPIFTNYGREQGLNAPYIWTGVTDRSGNLWFGSPYGAIRYDGKTFSNYTKLQGLGGSGVQCIIQDTAGNIWFGTSDKGVSRYDGKAFKNLDTADGLANNDVQSIVQDKAGNLWFGTFGGGISKYDGKAFKNMDTKDGLPSNYIRSMLEDKAGNLWIGTRDGGVSRFDGKKFDNLDAKDGLPDNDVNTIIQDKTGNLWFGTLGGGISRYDGKAFKNMDTRDGLPDNYIRGIAEDDAGNLWIGTNDRGICKYDGKVFINYNRSQGLASDHVSCIIKDGHGSLWIGTSGGGLSEVGGSNVTNYTAQLGLPGSTVLNIIRDKAGDLWFATEGGGVSKYDGRKIVDFSTADGLANSYALSIMQDTAGDIWIGTYMGACRFDGKAFTNYTTTQGLPGNTVYCILQDNTGNLWFGTDKGAGRYDGKSFTNYSKDQGLAANTIYSMIQDNAGNIWFGTGKGVSRYDGRSFTNYPIVEGLPGNGVISKMSQDVSGNIWFASQGAGVVKYDGKHFTNYSLGSGPTINVVNTVLEDPQKKVLWFGTDFGLFGMKEADDSNDERPKNAFEVFNTETDVLRNDVESLCLDGNDMLWVGGGDSKVARYNYSAGDKNSKPSGLDIQRIKINDQEICWNNLLRKRQAGNNADSLVLINEMITTSGNILSQVALDSMRDKFRGIKFDSITPFDPVPVNLVLPYEDNNIKIDFVAIEPALPRRVKYQYKLDGYNWDWSAPANTSSAMFTNLDEGNYTFRLKALSPYGPESDIEYKFKVLPPWYRTWWANTLFGLGLILCIWGFIYFRSRRLRRTNRLLEEKVTLRTDELNKSLEDLRATQSQLIQAEKMASLGELTAGIAHEIQNPLNFINNFSEVNKELIEEMQQEMDKGNAGDAKAISNDIKANEEKINHHGRRADAIVKGMLQHSRASTGQKELTDLNALTDEYLRLAYHGIRAQDKAFSAAIETDLDPKIGNIRIIPQDIGRVLLNLFNNAFYAVSEKKKQLPDGYGPTVTVTTRRLDGKVVISIKDNGYGIPQKVIDKIFQPFFTTKPTGQGTGLGLSLSYDIVKAHGGEIKVDTREGEWTEFTIRLPADSRIPPIFNA
jgi:ligand-binding sensor domain-containing protein/signal transduction histidine kinase